MAKLTPSHKSHPLHDQWTAKVAQLEAEGCSTSDAQSIADIEMEEEKIMSDTHFSACSSDSTRLDWDHGDYSGTITIPADCHSGPVDIEWHDQDLPENWEEIEEIITNEAHEHLAKPA